MEKYHKIKTVWERDPATNHKTLIEGRWATPEFEFLKDNRWLWTEKVDGTNVRVKVNEKGIEFAGKTDKAQLYPGLSQALVDLFLGRADEMRDEVFDGSPACLYGEGYGAKIQKGGGNYRPDQGFVLFDVLVGNWWLRREDVEQIADRLGLDVVPIIGYGTLDEMVSRVRRVYQSAWGPFPAEGIVARPDVELKNRAGRRIITKLKRKDFIA